MRTEYCRTHACRNIDKLIDEGCISEETGEELKRDEMFREKYEGVDFSSISIGALAPLRRESDKEIQQKVVSLVDKAGKEKVMNFGTAEKMKDALNRFRYVEPEAKADTANITATPYFFAQKVEKFVKWCFTQREEEVIREVIDKAIVNNR